MRKLLLTFLAFLFITPSVFSQYADLGTGALKNRIWWFDWNGFVLNEGATRVFNTADGLTVTITFTNLSGPGCTPNVMETWYGAVLHFLYDFSDPNIKPSLHTAYSTQNTQFVMHVSATRNGVPAAFKLVAADAEASAVSETLQLQTTGTPWTAIDFFRNSSQTSNPFLGCNTTTAVLTDTYGGSAGNGQNPVIATDALAGTLDINMLFTRNSIEGQSAVAFGIFAAIDRGDLDPSYGYAHHNIIYSSQNPCNYQPPFPSLSQSQNLKLGILAGDPDGSESLDDNLSGADEDAIQSFPMYMNNGTYSLNLNLVNTTGSNAYLRAWFDYNMNNVFDPAEAVDRLIPNNATNTTVTWTGLPSTLPNSPPAGTGFRFRLSTDASEIQNPSGFARDGEVEDYMKNISSGEGSAVFILPDTVCVGANIEIQNLTENGTTHYWNFCSGSLSSTPVGTNITSPGITSPVFMDLVQENGNYYAFVVNHGGSLARMNFGNNYLNTPTTTNLGSLGGIIPPQAEGIEIKKDGNLWVGYLIGGQNANSRLVRLTFGSGIDNPPTATNLGNIGNLSFPVDLTIVEQEGKWHGFTLSADNNTITRYDFGSSLLNPPVATNLGNLGSLSYPVGFFMVKDAGTHHLFIVNRNGNSITRIDFGADLDIITNAVNLGNPGNQLSQPRDITVIKDCDRIFGFVTNEGLNSLTRLDFATLLSLPIGTGIGNIGNLNFPHSISEIFRSGDEVNFFVPNVTSNSISRLSFSNCSVSSIPSFNGFNPPVYQYNEPGEYNVSLFVDEGLPTQNVLCKKIVVLPLPQIDFTFSNSTCSPLTLDFIPSGNSAIDTYWSFGDGQDETGTTITSHTYATPGTYIVKYSASNGTCSDTITRTIDLSFAQANIIFTSDTAICLGTTKQLLTAPALEFCWTPTDYLDNPESPTPTTSTTENITYYFMAKILGDNLITNGNFNTGNTGFISDYDYSPGSGVDPSKYNVGSNILAWHPGMAPCGDHTTGNGNMLMVNGAGVQGEIVWGQTITVQPNTTYAFSAWLQHITSVNPAQLQFSINGIPLGNVFQANNNSCIWEQFYVTWNSGNNTTAVISVINQNLEAWGNDFALDDISFSPLAYRRDSVIITVENADVETIEDTTICPGSSVTLTTTGAPNYSWSPSTWLSSSTVANPVATPESTIKYYVTGNTEQGCTDIDSVIVTVSSTINYTLTPDTTICKDVPLQLLANGPNPIWMPDPSLSNPNISNPVANPTTNNTYYVNFDDGNCDVLDSVVVQIRPDPVFASSATIDICVGDTALLNATGGHEYLWSPGVLNTSNPNEWLGIPLATTEYLVTITDTVCHISEQFSNIVTVHNLPVIIASKSNDLDCTLGFANLSASGADVYTWSPPDGLSNNGIPNPVATPRETTEYEVEGIDQHGCVNNATITVNVSLNNKIPFYMPNAFTPNNDGLNDCYGIKYAGFTEKFEFNIYNRWGERLFFTKNPQDCWNGMYKGVQQEIGVYVYMVRSEGPCGEEFVKGLFTLIR